MSARRRHQETEGCFSLPTGPGPRQQADSSRSVPCSLWPCVTGSHPTPQPRALPLSAQTELFHTFKSQCRLIHPSPRALRSSAGSARCIADEPPPKTLSKPAIRATHSPDPQPGCCLQLCIAAKGRQGPAGSGPRPLLRGKVRRHSCTHSQGSSAGNRARGQGLRPQSRTRRGHQQSRAAIHAQTPPPTLIQIKADPFFPIIEFSEVFLYVES